EESGSVPDLAVEGQGAAVAVDDDRACQGEPLPTSRANLARREKWIEDLVANLAWNATPVVRNRHDRVSLFELRGGRDGPGAGAMARLAGLGGVHDDRQQRLVNFGRPKRYERQEAWTSIHSQATQKSGLG